MSSSEKMNTFDQPRLHSLYDDASWEEQAFAEDAAGPHGGCVWPPRSYTCSFCSREFRSAQALGGHMNVHRRDRARLKQSISPQHDDFNHYQPRQQHPFQRTHPSIASPIQSQVCNLAYYPKPNPATAYGVLVQPSSTAKISTSSSSKDVSIQQHHPTIVRLGITKSTSADSQKQSLSTIMVSNHTYIQPSDVKMDIDRSSLNLKKLDARSLMHCDKPDISVSLNLFLCQNQSRKASDNEIDTKENEDEVESEDSYTFRSKRRKNSADLSSTMFPGIKASRGRAEDTPYYEQQKVFPGQSKSSSTHELDLELRLGGRPNVN